METIGRFVDYLAFGKESACNAGDLGSAPGSGRSTGEPTNGWLSAVTQGPPIPQLSMLPARSAISSLFCLLID